MKCPLCGEKVSDDDLFCGNCGYNLIQNEPDAGESEMAAEADEKAPPGMGAVLAGASEAEDAFTLPVADEGEAPPKGGNVWKTVMIVAVVLAVLLLCCCATVSTLFYFSGEFA